MLTSERIVLMSLLRVLAAAAAAEADPPVAVPGQHALGAAGDGSVDRDESAAATAPVEAHDARRPRRARAAAPAWCNSESFVVDSREIDDATRLPKKSRRSQSAAAAPKKSQVQAVQNVRVRADGLHSVEVVWKGGAVTHEVLQCMYRDPLASEGLREWLLHEWLNTFNLRQHGAGEVDELSRHDLECPHLSWEQLEVVFRGGRLST